jgi:hypothetical protein
MDGEMLPIVMMTLRKFGFARHSRTMAARAMLTLAGIAVIGAANLAAGAGTTAAAQTSATFKTFSLAEKAAVTCPGSTDCHNIAAEPQIRAAGDGTFYGSSENGLGGGTAAFKSTGGGLHYVTLPSPNQVSSSNTSGFAPGGGDTDVAVAPKKNAQGIFNVYVASLSLANVDVSTSTDGGKSWSLNPTSATIPGDDREWIAADGASKLCISYHDAATFNIDVACSTDAGNTFLQPALAIDSGHLFLINNNEIGNLAIDPASHAIYQIFSGLANAGEAGTSAGYHTVWIGVSTDGGKTFVDHSVFTNRNKTVSYGHQFTQVSIDRAGNVYALFSDDHNLFYAFSTTHGQSWSAPVKVNTGPSATAIEPWSVAGAAGQLDVVWYGTDFFDGKTTPDNYPSTAAWHVYFAQNLHATTRGSAFSQVAATPVIHRGGVCESGVTCSGNRDLFDDFGVAASPVTGLASIIYSDDQFDPKGPNSSGCKAAGTNSSACDHTAIATQTSGGRFSRATK